MILSFIGFAVIGWLIGVHAPWWIAAIIGVCVGILVLQEEGLGAIGGFICVTAPLMLGILLGGFIYGDLGFSVNMPWLLTGNS